jgi:hypothetical protein
MKPFLRISKNKINTYSRNLIIALLLLAGCNSGYRLYKRVGGDHLRLFSPNKELFWFKGVHCNDPKNLMFTDINTEFSQFNPDLVLVEGQSCLLKYGDELSAIKAGESNYTVYLAQQNGIECEDLEPSDSDLIDYLTTKYTKREVLTMYLIRQMIQWSRDKKGSSDFEYRVVKYLKWEDKNFGCFDEEINMANVSELLKPYTGIDSINNKNNTSFDASKYLYFSENKMNDIYNETYEFRNKYLLEVIEKALTKCDRIFIMMGFDHAIDVKEELNQVFNKY